MNLFMIYGSYSQPELRNSNGVFGVLVLTEDGEAEARLAAQDATVSGETKVFDEWLAVQLSADASLPDGRTVLFLGEIFSDVRRPV